MKYIVKSFIDGGSNQKKYIDKRDVSKMGDIGMFLTMDSGIDG